MPTLRPRKTPKKEPVEPDETSPEPSPLSSPPPKARGSKGSKIKTEKKPKALGRKSQLVKEEPEVVTIDETSSNSNEKSITQDDEIYYQLNEKELKEVNNAFDMNCSEDGEELLEGGDDLKTALRSLGYEPRADEIKKLLKQYSNKSGKINRANFQKIMALKYSTSPGTKDDMKDAISKVFNLFDLNRTGYITLENLRSVSKELNEEINDDELHEMVAEADEDGDFKISKDEFCIIMKKTSLY